MIFIVTIYDAYSKVLDSKSPKNMENLIKLEKHIQKKKDQWKLEQIKAQKAFLQQVYDKQDDLKGPSQLLRRLSKVEQKVEVKEEKKEEAKLEVKAQDKRQLFIQ